MPGADQPTGPTTPTAALVVVRGSLNFAERRSQAVDVVLRSATLAAASTTLPVPLADSATVMGVQLAMLAELSQLYGKTFSQDTARALLASLGGGALSFVFSSTRLGFVLKNLTLAIPVIGLPLRFLAGPVTLAGYTYLLGQAYILHYESGGNYADFDRKKFQHYLARLWTEAGGSAAHTSAAE